MLLCIYSGMVIDHPGSCSSGGDKCRNPHLCGRTLRRNMISICLIVKNIMCHKEDLQF